MANLVVLKKASVDHFLTVEEAASEMSVKSQTVRNGLTAGTFTTYKFKTLTLLSASEVRKHKKRVMKGK